MAKTKKSTSPAKKPSSAKTVNAAVKSSPKSAASAKQNSKQSRSVVAEIVPPGTEMQDSSKEELTDNDLVLPDLTKTSGSKALTHSDPVSLYLSEVRKYPLLTREQESALAKTFYDTKDPAAAQALVTANLRFVVKVAAEYSRFGARMIDLIQEGNMGLMHAVREFNPYKGVRLITYAVWWIRGYIQEHLMKQYSLVKIGTTQNQKKLFYQLQKNRKELDSMGQATDIKMLSTRLGIPEEEVKIMSQRMSGRDISLDRPLDDESGSSLMDFQRGDSHPPDEELSKREEISLLTDTIEHLRPQLSDREKIILEERILADEPLTLQEIGEKYGITREAVRQMETRLMKKIKDQYQKEEE